jgi:predicted transcriptional regulator
MFRLVDGSFVTNERGRVIEVSGGLDNENQNIVVNNKNGKVQ